MAIPKPAAPVTCPNRALALQYETAHRGYWDCVVPAEHSLEEVQHPAYFGRMATDVKGSKDARGQLCVGDIIDVEPESGDWAVRLRVMAYNRALQKCVTRALAAPVTFDVTVTKGYDIRWKGTNLKWVIIGPEGDHIAGGFASKTEAAVKLEEMLAESRRAA